LYSIWKLYIWHLASYIIWIANCTCAAWLFSYHIRIRNVAIIVAIIYTRPATIIIYIFCQIYKTEVSKIPQVACFWMFALWHAWNLQHSWCASELLQLVVQFCMACCWFLLIMFIICLGKQFFSSYASIFVGVPVQKIFAYKECFNYEIKSVKSPLLPLCSVSSRSSITIEVIVESIIYTGSLKSTHHVHSLVFLINLQSNCSHSLNKTFVSTDEHNMTNISADLSRQPRVTPLW